MSEVCENCGAPIGKLETPMVFNEHIVCSACYFKLQPPVQLVTQSDVIDSPPIRRASPPISPLEELARAAASPREQTNVYSPTYVNLNPRPNVQLIEKTSKAWKAHMVLAFFISCIGGLITVIACAASSNMASPANAIPIYYVGILLLVAGAFWMCVARIGAWWDHG